MTLPVEVNPLLTGGGGSGYNVSRSVRTRSSASAYLNRTVTTSGSGQKFTWSGWVKRGSNTASDDQWIFSTNSFVTSGTPPYLMEITFKGVVSGVVADKLSVVYESNAGLGGSYQTTAVYRDFAAWYHIVVAVDTTQATAGNRTLIYVNGQQVTSFYSATPVAQNTILAVNQTGNIQTIGALNLNGSPSRWFDGYITEVNWIDGQALTPSSFGGYNSVTGGWEARKYTGTYGTNGFRLNFSDNSAATAAAIGKDSSGNGNNWTPNNISLTAGVTYDSMIDSPTTGSGSSNYPVWNPVTAGGLVTFSEANLKAISTSSVAPYNIESTIKTATTGKWYAEVTMAVGANNPAVGIGNNPSTSASNTDQFTAYRTNATYITNGMGASSSGTPATFTTNDVIGIAYDVGAGTLVFYKNGTLQTGGFTGITAGNYSFVVRKDSASGDGGFLNFGQRPFSYTPPSGFLSINTYNLPAPAITKPNKNFDVSLYTGNGSAQSITNAGGFAPDLVWLKERSSTSSNNVYDSIRGTTKYLLTNTTDAEGTDATSLTSFNSNGFSLGGAGYTNENAQTYVGWQWKAGGTAVSNTAGTITSQVSANASAGFSVVTYTGTGANATVGHGLGVAPKMVIVKDRSNVGEWAVYHSNLTSAAYYLNLNTTIAQTLAGAWNSTAPTSGAFSVGGGSVNNTTSHTYVAYCFSEIAGYSKMGSYIGNGSNDGPFVYLGFKPKFLLIKNSTTAATNWEIWDTSRDVSNVLTNRLFPDSNSAESGGQNAYDFLSNGFKSRQAGSTDSNQSGATIIYIAFAETPFKNALAR